MSTVIRYLGHCTQAGPQNEATMLTVHIFTIPEPICRTYDILLREHIY